MSPRPEEGEQGANTDPLDVDDLRELRRELMPTRRIVLFLVHQDGVEVRELRAGEPLVVGREPPADLHVADTTLSRRHASFSLRPDGLLVDVADLASTNGTWIADRRVERATLAAGEEVMLGGVLARVRELAAPPKAAPSDAPSAGGAQLVAGAALSEVLRAAERAAKSRITVLLQGETGAGKEVIARHIHDASPRAQGPMICVNCGAIPRELVESTFFGHERGAFTGAHNAQRGVFENAHGGSVFLDEIGELPPQAQVALLRVLETGKITRVGATEERAVDVRVIAATHRDLAAMSEGQGFRKDLYFRLSAITLEIPPLRRRKEDIAPLSLAFLRAANHTHMQTIEGITARARERLEAYAWPGNVRELKNVIERAVVLAEGTVIDERDLPDRLRGAPAAKKTADAPEAGPDNRKLRDRVEAYEAEIIKDALASAGGNRSEAARLLGMPLRTLAHRIKALEIDEDDV
jgi:DNA-binding NtrC family response regulator